MQLSTLSANPRSLHLPKWPLWHLTKPDITRAIKEPIMYLQGMKVTNKCPDLKILQEKKKTRKSTERKVIINQSLHTQWNYLFRTRMKEMHFQTNTDKHYYQRAFSTQTTKGCTSGRKQYQGRSEIQQKTM